jgi:16S rRNA (uracil1498-N3)-methyltransferase
MPEIYEPMDILEMVGSFDKVALRLVLCMDESARPMSLVLPENPPESILLVVGPEGGFSGKEINLMIEGGFSPVIISPRRIKFELAGVLATTEILYNYGEDKKKEERWNTVSSVR